MPTTYLSDPYSFRSKGMKHMYVRTTPVCMYLCHIYCTENLLIPQPFDRGGHNGQVRAGAEGRGGAEPHF